MREFGVAPWPNFPEDELSSVRRTLVTGKVNYWTGNEGRKFEEEFASYTNTAHAVALANGTLALEVALEASGVSTGDEVIVSPRTFLASASCAVRVGAKPVFADVSPDSQNIAVESIKAAITPRTKAIIAVHHAGWPCEMDEIMSVANQHDLVVVEDCAQAHGALYKGRPVGGLGHVGAFSFCQDKVMTTGGEGGMLVTSDRQIWSKAWSIKDHGKNYEKVYASSSQPGFRWLCDSFGTNYRLTEMQSAIGRVQLAKLEEWNRLRTKNAARVIDSLTKFPSIRAPVPDPDFRHAYYRLYAFVREERLADGWDRDKIIAAINAEGIPCYIGSCPEIYKEQAFDGTGFRPSMPLPIAHQLGSASLAFLVHPTLSDDDLNRTCAAIEKVMAAATR